MKEFRLSEELGNIDEAFLEEVFEYKAGKTGFSASAKRVAAVAACAALVVGAAVLSYKPHTELPIEADDSTLVETAQTEPTQSVPVLTEPVQTDVEVSEEDETKTPELKVEFLVNETGGYDIDASFVNKEDEAGIMIDTLAPAVFHIEDEDGKIVVIIGHSMDSYQAHLFIRDRMMAEGKTPEYNSADEALIKLIYSESGLRYEVELTYDNGTVVLSFGQDNILIDKGQVIDEVQGKVYTIHIDCFTVETPSGETITIVGDWSLPVEI